MKYPAPGNEVDLSQDYPPLFLSELLMGWRDPGSDKVILNAYFRELEDDQVCNSLVIELKNETLVFEGTQALDYIRYFDDKIKKLK